MAVFLSYKRDTLSIIERKITQNAHKNFFWDRQQAKSTDG